jgi:Flp pilus assembly protein TadD
MRFDYNKFLFYLFSSIRRSLVGSQCLISGLFAGLIAGLVFGSLGCATNPNMSGGEENKSVATEALAEDNSSSSTVSEISTPVQQEKNLKTDPRYSSLQRAVRAGKSAQIFDEAAKILLVNPTDAVALNATALQYLRMKKTGAAKLLLLRALEKNPASAALHNNLGVALLDEGDQGGAIVEFKKALRVETDHPEALGNLGSLYIAGSDNQKAVGLLERSYLSRRSNLSIAKNYAIALRSAGKYDAAAQVYEELLQQNSRDVGSLLNYSILLIDFLNRPKDGLNLVYKIKLLETERKDVLARANALEKKAKSELK